MRELQGTRTPLSPYLLAKRGGGKSCRIVLDEPDADKARRASVGPYSATVAPISTKPATPIHPGMPPGVDRLQYPGRGCAIGASFSCSTLTLTVVLTTVGVLDGFYVRSSTLLLLAEPSSTFRPWPHRGLGSARSLPGEQVRTHALVIRREYDDSPTTRLGK